MVSKGVFGGHCWPLPAVGTLMGTHTSAGRSVLVGRRARTRTRTRTHTGAGRPIPRSPGSGEAQRHRPSASAALRRFHVKRGGTLPYPGPLFTGAVGQGLALYERQVCRCAQGEAQRPVLPTPLPSPPPTRRPGPHPSRMRVGQLCQLVPTA